MEDISLTFMGRSKQNNHEKLKVLKHMQNKSMALANLKCHLPIYNKSAQATTPRQHTPMLENEQIHRGPRPIHLHV
jgi:hypothetical protein